MREVNIYRAWNRFTGRIEYLVGTYADGQYKSPLNAHERRLDGQSHWNGGFSYCVKYWHESQARRFARAKYGYSRIANAPAVDGAYITIQEARNRGLLDSLPR